MPGVVLAWEPCGIQKNKKQQSENSDSNKYHTNKVSFLC